MPRQLKSRQLRVDDTFRLCSIDVEPDLTDEACKALVESMRVPAPITDFAVQSTPYLVARTLQNAGQRVMVNAFRYGESRILGFKIAADDEDSIRLELRFIASQSNY